MYIVYREISSEVGRVSAIYNSIEGFNFDVVIEVEGETPVPMDNGLIPVLMVNLKTSKLFYEYERPQLTENERIAALESENITLLMAITQLYEEKESEKAQAAKDSIDTMLALTELYEIVMGQGGGM